MEYYIQNYPASGPDVVLGFLTYDLVMGLQLDQIYTAPYFYASIALLGASLAACTYTRQLPAVKVRRGLGPRCCGTAPPMRGPVEPPGTGGPAFWHSYGPGAASWLCGHSQVKLCAMGRARSVA